MKNLKLLYSKAFSSEVLREASMLCANPDNQTVYFGSSTHLYWLHSGDKELSCRPLLFDASMDIEQGEEQPDRTVVAMDYLMENQTVYMAFRSGDVIVYSVLEERMDVVGSVASGICSSSWSQDQETLVVLTGAETFILMNKEFDPLLEKTIHPQEFGECSPITVGWGSKETQFHGSEGKKAAKVKVMEVRPAMPWDDKRPRVSWRGDMEYFVTSAIDRNFSYRRLRIWNREGILCYTCENKDGLEHSLCWRPSGNLIACTQQHPNKHEVIFFEKNGLHHGEFTLPFPPNSFLVKEVLWNADSTILLVWGHDISNPNSFKISLWTMSNYHWYLKKNLDFNSGPNSSIKFVFWDTQQPYLLHVLCDNQYLLYNWSWVLDRSVGTVVEDNVSVAVVDDNKVLITPFRKMIVPPPMCSYSLTCPLSINHITFSPCPSSEDFCVVLSNNQIVRFTKAPSSDDCSLPEGFNSKLQAAGGSGFKQAVTPHFYAGTYSVTSRDSTLLEHPLSLNHFTWIVQNSSRLLYVGSSGNSKSLLFSVELPNHDGSKDVRNLNVLFHGRIDGTVLGIATNENGSVAAIQLLSGKILRFQNGCLLPWLIENTSLILPSPCSQMSLHNMNGKKGKDFMLAFSSDKLCLFSNNKVLLPNCTSYCFHDDFIITTTPDSNLKCFSRSCSMKEPEKSLVVKELASQPVEKGSKIVASIPGGTKVILQAPRGNLETVHPRPLILAAISSLLDKLQYKEAFDIAKEHRINLNIFYDHNPGKFLDNVESFVEQVNLPADINQLLLSLTNENISAKLYPFQYSMNTNNNHLFTSKCDSVCYTFERILSHKDSNKYFESIIATDCQRTKPALDEALNKIKSKKDAAEGGDCSESVADAAMKFLLCLVDVNELYRVALGMYDFELAVMVAEKSNMDPKQYLAFLNELQNIEENYRKYKIDMHLQRYHNALEHISKCDDKFDECLALINSQRLYTSALNLFPPGSSSFKAVWEAYGDYLMSKHYYKEAGLAYWKSENYEAALKSYQEGGSWQLALSVAHHLRYSNEKIVLLAHSMALRLKERCKYEESAFLLEHYAQDVELSILTLITGHQWDAALNFMAYYNRNDIVATFFKEELLDYQSQLLSNLQKLESKFCGHYDRLEVLRQKEKKHKEKPLCSNSSEQREGSDNTDEDDVISETSSTSELSGSSKLSKQLSGSLVTRKSARSKKIELKKYRLKKGSPNEEIALIAELKKLVTEIDMAKDGFFSLLRALVQFQFEEEARQLQKKMKEVISMVERALPIIWITPNNSNMTYGSSLTISALIDVIQTQMKTIQLLSDPALACPSWRKSTDIFLQLLD